MTRKVRCRNCEGMTFNPHGGHVYKCRTINNIDEDPDRERRCSRFVVKKW